MKLVSLFALLYVESPSPSHVGGRKNVAQDYVGGALWSILQLLYFSTAFA
jgi:hypothetical protein